MLQSSLFVDTVDIVAGAHLLVLNSAADPFVRQLVRQGEAGMIILAEDNIALAQAAIADAQRPLRHVAFHDYILHSRAATMDVALMNLLYQPGTAWVLYGLRAARLALKPGGYLYVTGAKDRGILSVAKRMQELFGNVETLTISKGQRVVCARQMSPVPSLEDAEIGEGDLTGQIFAEHRLDEGTRLLLEALHVNASDEALDIGSGAGFIGLHIARLASSGHVTMVDVSLAAVEASRRAAEQSGLHNVTVLASDDVQAVRQQRFDLIATNPPFHQGGIQTMEIAERFIAGAARVLLPGGRFYLVANRFLKYEPTLRQHFKHFEEVGGDKRYKVLRGYI